MVSNFARVIGSLGVFLMSMLVLLLLCIPAWDALANGKLYYCTDGGTMDFILGPLGGGWVHQPESVLHVVPRPMDQPDEIKTGWSVAGLWCLWGAFVGGSVLVSALFARALWRVSSSNEALQETAAAPRS
jgi:hypothetical protein